MKIDIHKEVIDKFTAIEVMAKLLGHKTMLTTLGRNHDILWITSKYLTIIATICRDDFEMSITITDNDKKGSINKYFPNKDFNNSIKAIENLNTFL